MSDAAKKNRDAVTQIRRYLSEADLTMNGRLPPERKLHLAIGISRAELRKALSVLEAEGQIWRHVGRGTFVGPRPVANLADINFLTDQTSPAEVMEARQSIEPELARLAALHATRSDFAEMRRCARDARAARDWRIYEACDNRLHRAIAVATRNKLLISLYDTLNTVRRATVWGQLRIVELPPPDHPSFEQHDLIIGAVVERDTESAARHMRGHLRSVRDRVLAAVT